MQLSETANDVLLSAVRDAGLANGRCLRLVKADGGYGLTIDLPTGWDTVLQQEGRSILVMTKEVEQSLDDALIDVKEGEGAFQLMVYRPAA